MGTNRSGRHPEIRKTESDNCRGQPPRQLSEWCRSRSRSALDAAQFRDAAVGNPFDNVDVAFRVPTSGVRGDELAGYAHLMRDIRPAFGFPDIGVVAEMSDEPVVPIEDSDAAPQVGDKQ